MLGTEKEKNTMVEKPDILSTEWMKIKLFNQLRLY